ncbi:MAG: nucleotidyltransferase domain-containing protein [Promethearchaeota archaeon]
MQKILFDKIKKKLKGHPKLNNLIQFLNKFFKQYSAEFIILFGSSAKGNFNYRSDLDLLIITNSIKGNYFEKLYQMQLITPGAIDFFIYTSTEFEKMVLNFHLIALEALSSGIIIYDKGNALYFKNHITNLINQNKIQKSKRGWRINI